MSDDVLSTPGPDLRSFSGTHAYRPTCVSGAAKLAAVTDFGFDPVDDAALEKIGAHWAEVVAGRLDRGQCPRCRGALPELPELPAGSRVTACRCIPICGSCGADEATYPLPLWRWPTSRSAVSRRRNKLLREFPPQSAILHDGSVIDVTGAQEFKMREHPGGWAEFGHGVDG